jgi:hypothetical protein
MRFFRLDILALLFTVAAFAQTDRGTVTGTVTDSTGAVVPTAAITATNTETKAVYETTTTATGNYTLEQMFPAVYEMTVTAAGFTKYIQRGITVQAAVTARVDIVLQVGSTSESVTVTADAPLLRTDSAEVSHNMTEQFESELPLNGAGIGSAGSGGLRNPYEFITLMPGATMDPIAGLNIRVNGLPNSTYSQRVEGQEATYTQQANNTQMIQPGVDALQEVTLQTSSFAAEYGQMAGGLINFVGKSGTNEFHGSGFEFWKNEDLNAGQPFTNSGNGHLLRPKARRNDYGGSIGGPVYIPHLYNGHNKTFFFFNIERNPTTTLHNTTFDTVPTLNMRNGNFSQILTGRNLATDSQGNAIMENTIYDPATAQTVNGQVVTTPFPGNIIPQNRFDPVATKIQALLPLPENGNLVNNYIPTWLASVTSSIITVKIDENISAKSKLSFYYSLSLYNAPYANVTDGLPAPITGARDGYQDSPTIRLNYDLTVTPTLLVHAGVGFINAWDQDRALKGVLQFNAPTQLGLVGGAYQTFTSSTPATGFPQISGLANTTYGGYNNGGTNNTLGPNNAQIYILEKPSAVFTVMKVHSDHTYKAGMEWRREAQTVDSIRGSWGVYTFSNIETALPSTNGQSLSGGAVGFPYASFLLGAVDSAYVNTPQDPQLRKIAMSAYVQDSWKVTRKLTLDYGLRWDYMTAFTEMHDRLSSFAPTVPNPSAGGLLGGTAYAGSGPGRIGGQFAKNYPYGFGPRLGVAWQLAPKTVLRAGWGLTYGSTGIYDYMTNTPANGTGFNQLSWNPTSYGFPALTLSQGLQYTQQQLYGASLNPGVIPPPGKLVSPPYWLDPQGGRPSRVNQWSIGLQREITANLLVEAAFVGNRGVWLEADSLENLNALTPQRLASVGLNVNSAVDRTLLNSPLNSSLAASMGFSTPPYSSFPLGSTVAQALRPFPQFLTIPIYWSPVGDSWYDALQTKVTKRTSHGLTLQAAFTWSQELNLGTSTIGTNPPINDVFNRGVNKSLSADSVPLVFALAFSYRTPAVTTNRWIRLATRDWSIGPMMRYQSGLPIESPTANNALSNLFFQSTFANRVPGQPLFLKDLNCRCFDPSKTFVLNPAAWSDPAAGQWGTAAGYYNDYRYQHRPDEDLSLGRTFRVRERIRFEVRALFGNVLNRTYPNDPTSSNALATQVYNSAGKTVSGFGYINTGSTYAGPRSGLLQARFEF